MNEAIEYLIGEYVNDATLNRAGVNEGDVISVAPAIRKLLGKGSGFGFKWNYTLDGVEMLTLLRILTTKRTVDNVPNEQSIVGKYVVVAKEDRKGGYRIITRVVVEAHVDCIYTVGATQQDRVLNGLRVRKPTKCDAACYLDHTGSVVTAGKTTKIEDDPLPWEKEGGVKKLSELMSSKGGADEYYTPDYVVEEILRFIPKGAIVWCPFDKEDSAFVRLIGKTNEVLFGHIDNGNDYYDYEPDKWDMMISNPPFTSKRKIFERALGFGKPFCLLMTASWLNDAAPKQIWPEVEKDLQLMMFRNRVHFIKPDGSIEKKTNFSSAFFCADFLPKQIIISGK